VGVSEPEEIEVAEPVGVEGDETALLDGHQAAASGARSAARPRHTAEPSLLFGSGAP
jgi:hypothetical protein